MACGDIRAHCAQAITVIAEVPAARAELQDTTAQVCSHTIAS